MLVLIPMLLLAQQVEDGALLAEHRKATSAQIRCDAPDDDREIVVCGLRAAHRLRVPFRTIVPGDPKREGAPQERFRLIEQPNNCETMSPFLVGCGSVGLTAGTRNSRLQLIERQPPP